MNRKKHAVFGEQSGTPTSVSMQSTAALGMCKPVVACAMRVSRATARATRNERRR
jgi:hypothetical protein